MKNKILKLITNIVVVILWNNFGYDFFQLGLNKLQITQYFPNIPLYITFLLILRFVPPVLFTCYLWFYKR